MIKRASEVKEGDVLIGRRAGPQRVRADATLTRYRGVMPGVRIRVHGYPTLVIAGDPDVHVADDPGDAWNEHVLIWEKL